MSKQEVESPADDDAEGANRHARLYADMMDALDNHFHMVTCPDHTKEERLAAMKVAHEAFMAFSEYVEAAMADDDDDDPPFVATIDNHNRTVKRQNAPTSDSVH
jgi:hypothetical protein